MPKAPKGAEMLQSPEAAIKALECYLAISSYLPLRWKDFLNTHLVNEVLTTH